MRPIFLNKGINTDLGLNFAKIREEAKAFLAESCDVKGKKIKFQYEKSHSHALKPISGFSSEKTESHPQEKTQFEIQPEVKTEIPIKMQPNILSKAEVEAEIEPEPSHSKAEKERQEEEKIKGLEIEGVFVKGEKDENNSLYSFRDNQSNSEINSARKEENKENHLVCEYKAPKFEVSTPTFNKKRRTGAEIADLNKRETVALISNKEEMKELKQMKLMKTAEKNHRENETTPVHQTNTHTKEHIQDPNQINYETPILDTNATHTLSNGKHFHHDTTPSPQSPALNNHFSNILSQRMRLKNNSCISNLHHSQKNHNIIQTLFYINLPLLLLNKKVFSLFLYHLFF